MSINALEKKETNLPEQSDEVSDFKPTNVNLADLLNELDDMDGTTERKQAENQWFKPCSNKDCMYNLPKDAKFCLECGTAQMPKFCTECGYSFPGLEKFCPDCGNKR